MKTLALIAIFGALAAAPAQAADAAHGETLAKRWCAACHVVSTDQKSGNVDAPSFFDIAKRYDKKPLAVFLAEPHGVMPNMNLSQLEIADLVAHIDGLRAKP